MPTVLDALHERLRSMQTTKPNSEPEPESEHEPNISPSLARTLNHRTLPPAPLSLNLALTLYHRTLNLRPTSSHPNLHLPYTIPPELQTVAIHRYALTVWILALRTVTPVLTLTLTLPLIGYWA